jgi:hypothetical protein
MNVGNPCVSIDPEACVIFPASALPFDALVKAWLSDNPAYHEVSKNEPLRMVTFRNFGVAGTGTGSNDELLAALASRLLKCPTCGARVSATENYKARFVDAPRAAGPPLRRFVSDEVTLICYKCGSENRVGNWRSHLVASRPPPARHERIQ